MSDHERGAYTPPTDAPLAFEARQPVRGARPFPLTLVVSVLVLLGLAGAIFVFYRSGVRQAGAAPQVVGASVGGLKAAAPAEAQPQDPAAGLEIYRSEAGQPPQMVPNPPQFTPPPEQPQARPEPGPSVVVAPTAAPSQPAKVQSAELRPAQSAPPPVQPAPPPPAQPAPKTTPISAVTPAAKPLATPSREATAPTPKAAQEKPKPAAEKVAEKSKAPPVADKPAPTPDKGGAAVQIGAVSSTALADKTWNEAVALAPGLAAGKGKGVEKVEKDGKTLYRTSVTGFASRDAAQAFCGKLKAAGKACFVK